MSVLSPKRVILFVAATLLALPLSALNPSPRLSPRMAFDEESGVAVLFGGRGLQDPATALEHASDETWIWVRNHWVQTFPQVRPPARSTHAMVYDSARDRIILFGGRKEATVLRQRFNFHNDTWAWQNGEWTDLAPGNAPTPRYFHGMAYDRDRDRVILYGGYNYLEDGRTFRVLNDTWEFDGDNWTRVNENGPVITKPLIVFDAARHQTIMLGTDAESKAAMYRWNADASRWDTVTGTLPPCVNEGQLVYQTHNQRPLLAGGVCGGSIIGDETFEWDGSNWTEIPHWEGYTTGRQVDSAAAYDTAAGQTVRFGGRGSTQSTPNSVTGLYRSSRWRPFVATSTPRPRSMPLFRRDAERDVLWLFGGLSEYSYLNVIDYLNDLWRYQNGVWHPIAHASNTPLACATPIGALDTDRNVLIVVCEGTEVAEWNGEEWKTFSGLSTTPPPRRFAGGAYDQTLKKFVMFGGYDQFGGYRQDTWTWNGTAWAEIKPKTKPEHRAQPVMWYDPLAKKTIVYSGAGTGSIEDHAERFSDMWSFNGTEWTRITETAAPGIRFAPQVALDPNTGKLVMFGGLRATIDENDRVSQFYDNDLWIWDGASSTWAEVQTENAPQARQNAAFDYDPVSGKFVLFGGFFGNMYLSDRWLWDGETWTVVADTPTVKRRSSRP